MSEDALEPSVLLGHTRHMSLRYIHVWDIKTYSFEQGGKFMDLDQDVDLPSDFDEDEQGQDGGDGVAGPGVVQASRNVGLRARCICDSA